MKKLVFASMFLGLAIGIADAAPSYLKPDGDGGMRVRYDYTDKPKNNWYVTPRVALHLLSWTNEYSSSDLTMETTPDKYSMQPLLGGSVAFGKIIQYWYRLEAEVGYITKFTDADQGAEFTLSAPYLMVNGMVDFEGGMYIGGGLGVAMPTTSMDFSDIGLSFKPGDRSVTTFGPMGALMIGFTRKLDDNFVLDLRYRLAVFNGGSSTRTFYDPSFIEHTVGLDLGMVMDNSFSAGLRYEF